MLRTKEAQVVSAQILNFDSILFAAKNSFLFQRANCTTFDNATCGWDRIHPLADDDN